MDDILILKKVYNACEPSEPATAEYYLDCSDARGSSGLTEEFQSQLALVEDGRYLCFLFSGHVGCGKSSELKQLEDALSNPPAGQDRYFPVFLNTSDYLDAYDTAPTDILLAIVAELAATLRKKADINLQGKYLVKRFDEVKRLFSELEVEGAELPLWEMKVKIQRLKRDPTARQKVREALLPKMSAIKEEINTVFDEARLELKKAAGNGGKPYKDLVIILDNLEKILKTHGKAEGLESYRELFLERAPQLTGMNAHVVYTVPLRLVRSVYGPQLTQYYGQKFVLPMVKVTHRGDRTPYEKGKACLRSLIQRRLGGLALEKVFEPDALELLLTYSGGHVRYLTAFIKNASVYAKGKVPISLAAVRRAIGQAVETFSTSIPEHHWEKLARLDLSSDQEIPGGDTDYQLMLENLSVMEYINGTGDDSLTGGPPWYAVNPVVRELQKFKAAVEAHSRASLRQPPVPGIPP